MGQPSERRNRVIEDIADMEPVVTEHTIPRHRCPPCQKMFAPPVPDALPKATFSPLRRRSGGRLGALFFAWYDEIGQQIKPAEVLHADETGLRLSGETVWLWWFSSSTATCYMVDRSRGSPAWSTFFKEANAGA